MRLNIHHLEGRYAWDTDEQAIWGYFEKEYIPVKDGKISVKYSNSGDAQAAFHIFGDRTKADIPVKHVEVYKGDRYIRLPLLLTK